MKEENDVKDDRIQTLEKSLTDFATMRKRFVRIGNIIQEYFPDVLSEK